MAAKKSRTKRSAKGSAQQADRAYAEFEKLTRGIKPVRSEMYVEPTDISVDQPTR